MEITFTAKLMTGDPNQTSPIQQIVNHPPLTPKEGKTLAIPLH